MRARKCSLGILSTVLSYVTLLSIRNHYDNHGGNASESLEETHWIATSPSWLDRQACRWLGVCGATHLNTAGWTWEVPVTRSKESVTKQAGPPDPAKFWTSGTEDPSRWTAHERSLREVPQYVYEHTPYVHLFSGEEFWPCDVADHLVHTTPYLNYTSIEDMEDDRTLDNLDELNQYGRFTYLQSNDNVEDRPEWLGGSANIPREMAEPDDSDGEYQPGPLKPPAGNKIPQADQAGWYDVGVGDIKGHGGVRPNPVHPEDAKPADTKVGEELVQPKQPLRRRRKRSRRGVYEAHGHSSAPAVLVVVPKGDGIVDAFWFYFYSYNLGNQVLNVRFGNHVGDWEHSVVRFQNGTPRAVFLSEHSAGEAYSFGAVEKMGKRPVIYSAVGTHAMYATPGLHPYVLPWGLLHDQTDRGPLWDPILNHHAYVYNYTSGKLFSSTRTPYAPTSWFNYSGHWGDKFYPLSDSRQYRFAGQYHYVNGPLGPRFKNLGRQKICQGNGECKIKHWLSGDGVRRWTGQEAGVEKALGDD